MHIITACRIQLSTCLKSYKGSQLYNRFWSQHGDYQIFRRWCKLNFGFQHGSGKLQYKTYKEVYFSSCLVFFSTTVLNKRFRCFLTTLRACVRYFLSNFYFSLNDRPSRTMKKFISPKKLFSFSRYSNFCNFFPSFPHFHKTKQST